MSSISNVSHAIYSAKNYLTDLAYTRSLSINSRINKVADWCLLPLHSLDEDRTLIFTSTRNTEILTFNQPNFSSLNKNVARLLVVPGTILGVMLKLFNTVINGEYRKELQKIEKTTKLISFYGADMLRIFGQVSQIQGIDNIGHRPNIRLDANTIHDYFPRSLFEKNCVIRGTFSADCIPFIAVRYTRNDDKEVTFQNGSSTTFENIEHVAVFFPRSVEGKRWYIMGSDMCVEGFTGREIDHRSRNMFQSLLQRGSSPAWETTALFDTDALVTPRYRKDGHPIYELAN